MGPHGPLLGKVGGPGTPNSIVKAEKIFRSKAAKIFFREKGPMGGPHGPLLGKVGGPGSPAG